MASKQTDQKATEENSLLCPASSLTEPAKGWAAGWQGGGIRGRGTGGEHRALGQLAGAYFNISAAGKVVLEHSIVNDSWHEGES